LKHWSAKDIDLYLAKHIEDPQWRSIFRENIKRDLKSGTLRWNFEEEYLYHNVNFNKADSIGYWAEKNGLFTGRVNFIFPEYSRWVHLNTNTLAMFKVCAKVKGFGHDIFAI